MAGLQADRSGDIVWSDLIIDASGLGLAVVATAPVYSDDGVLVGVAGTDLAIDDLGGESANLNLLTFLRDRSSQCAAVVPSECLLQRLRQAAARRVGGRDMQDSSVCSYSSTNASHPLYAPALGNCTAAGNSTGTGSAAGCPDGRPRARLCPGEDINLELFKEGACCGEPDDANELPVAVVVVVVVVCALVVAVATWGWCAGWCGGEGDGSGLAKGQGHGKVSPRTAAAMQHVSGGRMVADDPR